MKCGSIRCRVFLPLAEGLAVGALILGGIRFMGAHQNPVQGTVVLLVTVVGAGLDGTLDALVCMFVHSNFLLKIGFCHSITALPSSIQENASNLAFARFL